MLSLLLLAVLGSALALGVFRIGIALIWLLLLAIGRWRMFAKMGESGWKGFIPIYSDYILYRSCWQTIFFWIALIASAICGPNSGDAHGMLVSLAGSVSAVVGFLLSLRVSRSFGHGIPFAIGLTLAEPLFMLYLGFGPDHYRRLETNGIF